MTAISGRLTYCFFRVDSVTHKYVADCLSFAGLRTPILLQCLQADAQNSQQEGTEQPTGSFSGAQGNLTKAAIERRLRRLCTPAVWLQLVSSMRWFWLTDLAIAIPECSLAELADGSFKIPKEMADKWKSTRTRHEVEELFRQSNFDKDCYILTPCCEFACCLQVKPEPMRTSLSGRWPGLRRPWSGPRCQSRANSWLMMIWSRQTFFRLSAMLFNLFFLKMVCMYSIYRGMIIFIWGIISWAVLRSSCLTWCPWFGIQMYRINLSWSKH